jgi:glycosyltransferase involved in cell wall biosynthesis
MIQNVVIINDFGHVNGGASQVAILSACELSKAGYGVHLLCGTEPIDPRLAASGVQVLCTQQADIASNPNKLDAMAQGIWNVKSAKMLGSLLSTLDKRNTIVHLHGWTKTLSSSVAALADHMGFRVICTLHDYFTACPNGGFYNYQTRQACQLKPLSMPCLTSNCDARSYGQKLWRVARQVVQSRIGKMPSSVADFIYVSDFSKNILRDYLPAHARFHAVPNPIEASKPTPADVARNGAYVFVGRISPEKGARFLATATSGSKLKIVFVGDGSDRADMLREFPDIEMPGWASPEAVATYIRNARALVFPSLWYETQGLVVAEAAAQGVPALVADKCAARDMVIDGETGLWFESGNASSLRHALGRMQDDSLVARLGSNAFNHYWSKPATLDAHLQALLQSYEKCFEHERL